MQNGYNVQQTEQFVSRILENKPRPRRRMMVKDVRLFVNTIERAVKLMTGNGIPATATKKEQEDYIECGSHSHLQCREKQFFCSTWNKRAPESPV